MVAFNICSFCLCNYVCLFAAHLTGLKFTQEMDGALKRCPPGPSSFPAGAGDITPFIQLGVQWTGDMSPCTPSLYLAGSRGSNFPDLDSVLCKLASSLDEAVYFLTCCAIRNIRSLIFQSSFAAWAVLLVCSHGALLS